MSWRRLTTGVASAVSLVLIPAGGLYGALRDPDNLTPLSAALYLAMMNLVPAARVLDLMRRAAELPGRDDQDDDHTADGSAK
jgi:hypothetical protein